MYIPVLFKYSQGNASILEKPGCVSCLTRRFPALHFMKAKCWVCQINALWPYQKCSLSQNKLKETSDLKM